jgi:mannose-6-phosphate isomerase-like protein (cupin superfamily)
LNHVFGPRGYFKVPDGTDVSPFLNATDVNQTDVPWGALGEMSIASGRIDPGVNSWVAMRPATTEVTYLLSGRLTIRMKDANAAEPYDLNLQPGQAVISEPGTLVQFRNISDAVAEVLYITTPTYVFETEGDEIFYDETIIIAPTWEQLEVAGYDVPALRYSATERLARREEALRRLAARKAQRSRER